MSTATIDLDNYRTPESRVFTGRDRGKEVRIKSNLDRLERENDQIEIIIPQNIGSINPSFLEEFLINVVLKLRSNGFHDKVKFKNTGRYKIEKDLNEAIERILRDKNALSM